MAKAASKPRAATGPKKMSPYNKFMKEQLPKWKESNPSKSHKDAFRAVAELWAKAPENPKNQTSA